MNDLYAFQLVSQLFTGGGRVYLDVVFLAFLLIAVIFKPDRIRSPALFRIACFLFAAEIVIPSILVFFLDGNLTNMLGRTSYRGPRAGGGGDAIAFKVFSVMGPSLFAASFLLAILSLAPTLGPQTRPVESPRSPFDD